MFEIYDLVLNFCNAKEKVYDFFEWQKSDKLTYINKIPLIKINSLELNEILNNIIKIDNSILLKIKNKTITENNKIPYSFLITDDERVIALKFNENGILIERSSLLLDEELAVIEESRRVKMETLNYEIIRATEEELFLTRDDKNIRSILLKKINKLYNDKAYDAIDYLYQEISTNKIAINKEYEYLIEELTKNYDKKYYKLYDIIKLTLNNKK